PHSLLNLFLVFYCSLDHPHLYSFPTRRSSDLLSKNTDLTDDFKITNFLLFLNTYYYVFKSWDVAKKYFRTIKISKSFTNFTSLCGADVPTVAIRTLYTSSFIGTFVYRPTASFII